MNTSMSYRRSSTIFRLASAVDSNLHMSTSSVSSISYPINNPPTPLFGSESEQMATTTVFSTATAATSVSPLRFPSNSFKGNVRILVVKRPVGAASSKSLSISTVRASKSSSEVAQDPIGSMKFGLDNLGPQKGAKKKGKRKGRGIAAGQGNSCGFGMRGQKSRSGPGIMRGFEGGQTALYRRLPKLRGIAGGMRAGLPKYLPINIKDIESAGFQDGDEISLESLKEKRLINPSGRESRLPLKILGEGELTVKLNIKARAFSIAAKEKLEAAGCTLTTLPGRKKWRKPSVLKNITRAEEYFAKKRDASSESTAT